MKAALPIAAFLFIFPAVLHSDAPPGQSAGSEKPAEDVPQADRPASVAGEPEAPAPKELAGEPVTFEAGIPYADTGNPRHRLDLYRPKNPASAKLPVIVFFHGGGWMQGDKADGERHLIPFVRTGEYAGVSAGYRLTDEEIWPAQIHDAKAAVRWVRANAEKYGIDPQRIGVLGRSAGGHLALMLAVTGDVPELEGEIGAHLEKESRVQAAVNFFGITDFTGLIGQPGLIDRTRRDAPEALLIGGPVTENPEKAKAASPVNYVTPNDSPVLTVHGTADEVVPYDQSVRIDAALNQAGVPSFFVAVKDAGHGDFGTSADGRARAFFDTYLRGEDIQISLEPITNWKKETAEEAGPAPVSGERIL